MPALTSRRYMLIRLILMNGADIELINPSGKDITAWVHMQHTQNRRKISYVKPTHMKSIRNT